MGQLLLGGPRHPYGAAAALVSGVLCRLDVGGGECSVPEKGFLASLTPSKRLHAYAASTWLATTMKRVAAAEIIYLYLHVRESLTT